MTLTYTTLWKKLVIFLFIINCCQDLLKLCSLYKHQYLSSSTVVTSENAKPPRSASLVALLRQPTQCARLTKISFYSTLKTISTACINNFDSLHEMDCIKDCAAARLKDMHKSITVVVEKCQKVVYSFAILMLDKYIYTSFHLKY